MITNGDEARRIADAHLRREYGDAGRPDVVIVESATRERPCGWLYLYTTAHGPSLLGAGPFLVRREDGRIVEFSSFYSVEAAADAYEEDPARFSPIP
jgi:hypothetical protein